MTAETVAAVDVSWLDGLIADTMAAAQSAAQAWDFRRAADLDIRLRTLREVRAHLTAPVVFA